MEGGWWEAERVGGVDAVVVIGWDLVGGEG